MKIISKFKDYYDGATFGVYDDDLIYARKEIEKHVIHLAPINRLPSFPRYIDPEKIKQLSFPGDANSIEPFIICFCGKLYPIVSICKKELIMYLDTLRGDRKMVSHRVFSTLEELEENIDSNPDVYGFSPVKRVRAYKASSTYSYELTHFKDFFELSGKDTDINERYNSPIVVIEFLCKRTRALSEYVFRVDTNLEQYGFARLVPPPIAYQEIAMWLATNKKSEEADMAVVTDECRIQQHGFDKSSFRKSPTKVRK